MKINSKLYRYIHNILLHLFRKYKPLNRCFNLLPHNIIYSIDQHIEKNNITQLQQSYQFVNNNINYDLYDNNILLNYKHINFPPINSYLLHNIAICTQTGYIIDLNSKSVITQSYPYGDKFLPHTQFYNSIRNHKITNIETNLNPTFLIATTNYCHWFTEFIGRALYFLNHYDNAIIYTNPFLYQWQHQSLEIFNIDKSKIQFVYDKYIHFNKLYFVNYSGLGIGLPDSKMIKKLNNIISKNIKNLINTYTPPYKHIYITRKKASHRKAINENNLIKILSKYNFQIIDCEELSVIQQFLLFNNATFIVAIHGPALTNSIAANNSTIIELFNEYHITGSYYHFASISGNRYIALKCKNIGNPVIIDEKQFFGYNDIEIDLHKLEEIINKFLS